MAQKNKATLKGFFETGDKPNQTQYHSLIDSSINLEDQEQVLNDTFSIINSNDNVVLGFKNSVGKILATEIPLSVESSITSSINISASGTIVGNNLIATGSTATSSFAGNVNINTLTPDTLKLTVEGNISASSVSSSRFAAFHEHPTLSTNEPQYRFYISNISSSSTGITEGAISHTGLRYVNGNLVIQTSGSYTGSKDPNLTMNTLTGISSLTSEKFNIRSNNLVISASQVDFSGLPTSDPGIPGRIYNDSGIIKISL